MRSCGSSVTLSCSSARSGWRYSALLSMDTLASRATTRSSAVQMSGLISMSVASRPMKASYDFMSASRTPFWAGSSMPAWYTSQRPWCGWKPMRGSTCRRASASGCSSATASMSMPPMAESITRGFFAERSNVTEA